MTNKELEKKLLELQSRVEKMEKCLFVEPTHLRTESEAQRWQVGDKVDFHGTIYTVVDFDTATKQYRLKTESDRWQVITTESELSPIKDWVFTDDEKVILRNVTSELNWLVRDKGGRLNMFMRKPRKHHRHDLWVNEGDNLPFIQYSHLFQSIEWEDDEPCEFRKYL